MILTSEVHVESNLVQRIIHAGNYLNRYFNFSKPEPQNNYPQKSSTGTPYRAVRKNGGQAELSFWMLFALTINIKLRMDIQNARIDTVYPTISFNCIRLNRFDTAVGLYYKRKIGPMHSS